MNYLHYLSIFIISTQIFSAAMPGKTAQARFNYALVSNNLDAVVTAFRDLTPEEQERNKAKYDAFKKGHKLENLQRNAHNMLKRLMPRKKTAPAAAQTEARQPAPPQEVFGGMNQYDLRYKILMSLAQRLVKKEITSEYAINIAKEAAAAQAPLKADGAQAPLAAGTAPKNADYLVYVLAKAVFFALPKTSMTVDRVISPAFTKMETYPEELLPYFEKVTINIQDYINHGIMPIVNAQGQLNLAYMYLTSLEGIQNVPSIETVTYLNAAHNRLSTESISALCNLSHLRSLNLTHNGLTDIPQCIMEFKELRTLSVAENMLTTIPENIGDLTLLQNLDLYDNEITTLPASMSELNNLRTLNIAKNRLTILPSFLNEFRHLRDVRLLENPISTQDVSSVINGTRRWHRTIHD